MSNLLYQYTTYTGLRVSDKLIKELLSEIGKTEDEIINFLGKQMMESHGTAYCFLDSFASQVKWYKNRNNIKD